MNDFARRDAGTRPGPRTAPRAGRTAAACLAAGVLAATLSGCSWLASLPGFGDHASPPAAAEPAQPSPARDAFGAARDEARLSPQEAYWPFHLGELYAAADSTARAVECLKQALAVDPSYAPAASLLSKLYYQSKMYPQAVALLDDFLARNPQAPDALRAALALNLDAAGDRQRAQSTLLACREDSREVCAARSFVALRADDLEPALDAAKHALDADHDSAANHNNYGIALLYAGRPLEARDAFKRALALDDHLPGALYNMAIVEAFYFFEENEGRQWFARYRQIASEDPDNLASHFGADVSATEKPGRD